MQENPYSAILRTVRRDREERTGALWRLGIVITVSPLTVRLDGMDLTGADLLLNSQLMPNTEQVTFSGVSGSLRGSADCAKGSVEKLEVSGGTLSVSGLFGGVLLPGDKVALLPSADGQQYLVLCRVVNR